VSYLSISFVGRLIRISPSWLRFQERLSRFLTMNFSTTEATTSIDSSISSNKKVASLRKMVQGARKAMERRPEKTCKASRNTPEGLQKTTRSSNGFTHREGKSKSKRSVKNTKVVTEAAISPTSSINDRRRQSSVTRQQRTAGKKFKQNLSATSAQFHSPKKLKEKVPYVVRDLPQDRSPSKSPSKYGSPKKRVGSPQKLGSRCMLHSPQRLYVVSCFPPYVGDDDDDDDDEERSLGSFGHGHGVAVLESRTGLNSSWATLDPSESSNSSLANLFPSPQAFNANGQRQQITDHASDSSFTSWGNISIGADKEDLAHLSLALIANIPSFSIN